MSPFKLISFLFVLAVTVTAIPSEINPESVEFTPSVTGSEPEVTTTEEPEVRTVEKPAVNGSEQSAAENEESGKNGQPVSDAEQTKSDGSDQVEKHETESKEIEDMDTAATGAIDELLIDQNYVGRYNSNPCKDLGK